MDSAVSGYFECGLPYNRFGRGPRSLVVLQGTQFENRPQSGLSARFTRNLYKGLEVDYTIHVVTRKPGLPRGYALRDMSDDYAAMIRKVFGEPLDIIGLSTGGLIAQHLAAEHPDLIRRLVLHSSAYRLSEKAKHLQLRVGNLACEGRWKAAYAAIFTAMFPRQGAVRHMANAAGWLASPLGGLLLGRPKDPSDLLVTYEASNMHNFKDRLAEIKIPTLLLAGDRDPFYTPTLFRDTVKGIPNGTLILYEGVGHPASGKRFARDLQLFLTEAERLYRPNRPTEPSQ
jgi:pimeloyl-ACP methyl ester carboxylesterase